MYYQKSEAFVKDFFEKSRSKVHMQHFIRTAYWIKKLNPDADEALLIAGVSHDLSHALKKEKDWDKIKNKGFMDKETLEEHQKKSAEVIGNFLENEGAPPELVKRVKHLVSHHEIGGDEDQNLLMDADSISFFENNVEHFVNDYVKKFGKEIVKKKFDFMFNRISSEERKNICRPMYEEAVEMLI
jgi:hypothetical protein